MSTKVVESPRPFTVSILAANGQQSSAIVAHLLSLGSKFSKTFKIRAIVRDPSRYTSPSPLPPKNGEGENPAETAAVVDEVVRGDMIDINSLKQAFSTSDGTDILWAMTNPNPAGGIEAEVQSGKNIVDAFLASINDNNNNNNNNKTATSSSPSPSPKPLLLFSSGIDAEAITKGELKMVNATSKGHIESYIHSLPPNQRDMFRVTFVHAGMFMQNFTTYQIPTVDDEGVYHFAASVRSDVQVPFVDITDLGPLVWHLIQLAFDPDTTSSSSYDLYDRASVRLFGEYLSYPQLVEQFTKTTGKPAVYDAVDLPKFLSLTFGCTEAEAREGMNARTRPADKETVVTMIADMYNLINRYGYYGDGAVQPEDREKDVRLQKIISQQPTRRTGWTQFVRKNFCSGQEGGTLSFRNSGTTSSTTAATTTTTTQQQQQQGLSVPSNFPDTSELSPAETFLYNMFSYFLSGSRDDPAQPSDYEEKILKPYFHPTAAVVEFPYFPVPLRSAMGLKPLAKPEDEGAILKGYDEILAYFKDWRKVFHFDTMEIKSLAKLSSSSASSSLATPHGALIEAHVTGTVKPEGPEGKVKSYVQDYVSMAYLDSQGKVVRYQEHWVATRM